MCTPGADNETGELLYALTLVIDNSPGTVPAEQYTKLTTVLCAIAAAWRVFLVSFFFFLSAIWPSALYICASVRKGGSRGVAVGRGCRFLWPFITRKCENKSVMRSAGYVVFVTLCILYALNWIFWAINFWLPGRRVLLIIDMNNLFLY